MMLRGMQAPVTNPQQAVQAASLFETLVFKPILPL
jgi:hypothetical protein